MKIIALSDTHNKHRQIPLEWLEVEDKKNTIIIHAGDISGRGGLTEIEDFCDWYDKLDFPHKIFCAGNHDWGFQEKPKEVATIISKYPTTTYLQDDFVIIDGIKIYCSPWQPFFYNWAFNLQRGKELQDKWDLIDLDSSIIVTHGPVHGLLDMAPDGRFTGCEDLLNTIVTKLNDSILHICGHIHCAHGFAYKYGKTFVNASILNESYMVAYKPIIIDFDKETKKAVIVE